MLNCTQTQTENYRVPKVGLSNWKFPSFWLLCVDRVLSTSSIFIRLYVIAFQSFVTVRN